MLKKSKIIAMTKLAIYEKHKGEEALEITKYYREDYISNRILQGVIRYTAIFILLLFLYLLMQGEELLYKMSFVFLVSLGRKIVILYLMGLTFFVAVFLLFSYFTYEKALEERQKVEQGLEEILSLSQGSKEPKRPEEKEKVGGNAVQYARKEVQDIVLQMKREGEKLDFTPLYSRDREGKESTGKKTSLSGNTVTKKKPVGKALNKKSGDWLDAADDWLDE